MTGNFYFFINHEQAMSFGHIGWGFDNPDGSCTFGSTDHIWKGVDWRNEQALQQAVSYICFSGPGNDAWVSKGRLATMLAAMRSGIADSKPRIAYDGYKSIPVPVPNAQHAFTTAQEMDKKGWCLVNNNCLDHATSIANAYGVGWNSIPLVSSDPMPWKQTHWAPNAWFDALLPGTEVALHSQTLTALIHSEWGADVTIDVDSSSITYHVQNTTSPYNRAGVARPRSIRIHIIPRTGKAIENLDPTGHVSYDVTCVVFYEGVPLASYRKNGWDPKGTDFSSQMFSF